MRTTSFWKARGKRRFPLRSRCKAGISRPRNRRLFTFLRVKPKPHLEHLLAHLFRSRSRNRALELVPSSDRDSSSAARSQPRHTRCFGKANVYVQACRRMAVPLRVSSCPSFESLRMTSWQLRLKLWRLTITQEKTLTLMRTRSARSRWSRNTSREGRSPCRRPHERRANRRRTQPDPPRLSRRNRLSRSK